ncbi:MAG: site-2 protease family protein [Verrucomicrobia bacterium]|nr:site-2 protease family protein [Verrucomicrobiota bacterium]
MNQELIQSILVSYAGLVLLLTFHEVGHAWMAWKCGDDTAKKLGRVSLNPLVHMEFLGTVVLPLAILYLGSTGSAAASFLVGWAKPVPVDANKLKSPKVDDILISMAGPAVNLILAILLLALARMFYMVDLPAAAPICKSMAQLSLMLCFFNLIPIPPLDGSHVVRVLIGMSIETYLKLAQYGFILVILALQIPGLRLALYRVNRSCYQTIAGWFGLT